MSINLGEENIFSGLVKNIYFLRVSNSLLINLHSA